mgnify:FL=1
MIYKSIIKGLIGAIVLLVIYFVAVSLISGWPFAVNQFAGFWYFITSLAAGFGTQIGLYSYLRNAVRRQISAGVVATSGTTSTIAMISCCAHYLANILPIIGASGVIALIGQYQVEIFWLGLAMNALGIGYIINRIIKLSQK